MTKSAKIAFSVAAAAVIGLGAGAYHVHENVIPEQMAQQLNATLQDAYGNIEHSEKTHLSIDGGITVESDGFLTYKATTPMFLLQADMDGADPDSEADDLVMQVSGSADEFQITFPDKMQAVQALFSDTPQLDVNFKAIDGTGFGADVTSAANDQMIVSVSVALSGLEGTISINGDDYAVSTNSAPGSVVYGQLRADEGHVAAFFAELDAETSIHFSSGDYAGSDSFTLQNAEIDIFEVADLQNSTQRLTIDEIAVASLYEGQSAEGRNLTSWENIDLSMLPDDAQMSVAVTGLKGEAQDKTFDVDVSYSAGITDLRSDNTSLQFEAAYEVSGNIMDVIPLPDKGDVAFKAQDIPTETLKTTWQSFLEDEDSDMEPLFALIGLQAEIISALEEAGARVTSTVGLESTKDDYGVAAEFNHHVEGLGTPGKGFIRIDNFENAAQAQMAATGQEGMMLVMMLQQLGKPTADGKGIIIEYDLDARGGLSLNGQPMGLMFQP